MDVMRQLIIGYQSPRKLPSFIRGRIQPLSSSKRLRQFCAERCNALEIRQQIAKQGTQNLVAYRCILKGLYWNKRAASNVDAASSCFNQAIAKDPGYALALRALADVYSS
jgi:hypothetical protein